MKRAITIVLFCLILAACNSVKNTPLPQDLGKMESIKPAMEKLTPAERDLATGYIMRHTLFGGAAIPEIPEGMTIGKAIEDQTQFLAQQKAASKN